MHAIDLEDRVYIVTGASRGMGAEMASALVVAGGRVVLVAPSHDCDELHATVAEISRVNGPGRSMGVVADIAVYDGCRRVVDQCLSVFGQLDGLISNAGLGPMHLRLPPPASTASFWEIKPELWADIIRVNVTGTFNMAHAVAPVLIRRRWGRIVNTSTGLSTMQREGGTPYGPSKAAIEAMTLSWSRELSLYGITVNSLLPGGTTDTAFVPDEVRQSRVLIPPSVMRAPAVWLMSTRSASFTGSRLIANRWNEEIAPDDAAQAASEPPVFRSP